jgi:hypothetical protein
MAVTLDMHALTLYRLAMKNPEARNNLLSLAAALQRGAAKLSSRRGGVPDEPAAKGAGAFNRS